jgi:putative ABC transport system substrate-binding protein
MGPRFCLFLDDKRKGTKNMKKLICILLALTMLAALCACSGSKASTASASAASAASSAASSAAASASASSAAASSSAASGSAAASAAASSTVYHVGICQLVQHPALDAATKGFKEAMTKVLGADKVVFDEQNAQGDSATCATICNQFVADNDNLILANATPALQAAASATSTIPIIGTSITDYATALNIKDFSGSTGVNVSGTSDLAPLKDQAAMIEELFPQAKTVGILFCSAEPNSYYQASTIEGILKGDGITCKEYTFTDSNDVASVTTTACSESDVLYIPTDNTAASNTEVIKNIAVPAKKAIVCGEEGICSGCGVATLSINYYDIGYAAGEMACEVLTKGTDIKTMPIQFAPKVTKEYNADICKTLGLTVPSDYTAIAAQ